MDSHHPSALGPILKQSVDERLRSEQPKGIDSSCRRGLEEVDPEILGVFEEALASNAKC